MRKSLKGLNKVSNRMFENDKARKIYLNSSFQLYKDKEDIYYLDENNCGGQIEYCCYGSIEDIEQYLIEVFGDC